MRDPLDWFGVIPDTRKAGDRALDSGSGFQPAENDKNPMRAVQTENGVTVRLIGVIETQWSLI